ncbi:LuxR C-terminal-related transcriptional regulator [uncultured Brevundimonas sp.]|uniref:LuxR C-terminal-related transcriptional regulator n=1 Tax=uncultured Brevundimonas sp. TaxID=213418 RepID=UPI00345DD4AD
MQAGQIAEHLALATTTVESHLASARRKLDVTSSRAAVQLLRRAGCLHTGYGEGFSLIVLPGEIAPSAPANGAENDLTQTRSSPVELGRTGDGAPGNGQRGTSSRRGAAYPEHDPGERPEPVDDRPVAGGFGPGSDRPQSFGLHIPAVPPRGLLPRLGLVLIAAFLLVVMLAVLVSVHTLLQ